MPRRRRRLRRWTYRLRRRWHRIALPLRRPARALLVLAMGFVVAAGAWVTVAQPGVTYNTGDRVARGPDSTLVLEVAPRGDAALAGLASGDRLLALDGRPITAARADSLMDEPYLLKGTLGDVTRFRVVRGADTLTAAVELDGQVAADARQLGWSLAVVRRILSVATALGLLAFAAVGLVVFVRARARGYLASLGMALLTVAGGGLFAALTQDEGALPAGVAAAALALGSVLFLSALPVVTSALVRFPDGRFVPRWSRYVGRITWAGILTWLVSLGVLLSMGHIAIQRPVTNGILLVVLAVPLAALVQRYRRSEDAVVRQQMKWVVLPVGVFFAVYLVAAVGPEAVAAFDEDRTSTGFLFGVAMAGALAVALAAIPLGVLAGVLGFRPWDADLWIARSAAIGAATLGLAAAFAGSAEALRVGLRASMGEGGEAVAAALAAVVALVVFNPVREWLTRRADADLIRARERLTERLPLLLAGRQVVATPEEIGRVAIAAVRDALETERAAVIDLDADGWEVVAAEGAAPGAALAWAEAVLDRRRMPPASDQVWEDPLFVLRVPLRSAEDELVGVLALGTHGKGRGYSTEERRALEAASRSLAEALRVAERRVEAEARAEARLAALLTEAG